MELNSIAINQIITDLRKSLVLHNHSITNWETQCHCLPLSNTKCFPCAMKETRYDIDCLIHSLESIKGNTSYQLRLIDAEAFRYALETNYAIDKCNCYPHWYKVDGHDSECQSNPDTYLIDATIEREAYDGNGYHVGSESITFQWEAIKKDSLGITGSPYLLSRWVINPYQYKIVADCLPPNDEPDQSSHDPECEFVNTNQFDDCDCLDNWNGYFQPDEDFFYSGMESIICQLTYPEATFDPSNREWQLGNISFNLNEFESNQEYKDSCNEDNGAPDHI